MLRTLRNGEFDCRACLVLVDDFQKLSDTRYGVAFGELNDKHRTAVAAAVAFTDAMYPFDRVKTDRVCD